MYVGDEIMGGGRGEILPVPTRWERGVDGRREEKGYYSWKSCPEEGWAMQVLIPGKPGRKGHSKEGNANHARKRAMGPCKSVQKKSFRGGKGVLLPKGGSPSVAQ